MKVRPLDDNGDFVPVYSLTQMVSGAEAVKQAVEMRLRFYHGEWWEDEDIGFEIPDFLVENIRSGEIDLVSKYISQYIASTQDVQSVDDTLSVYSDHILQFACVITTTSGEEEEVEVDVDGLL